MGSVRHLIGWNKVLLNPGETKHARSRPIRGLLAISTRRCVSGRSRRAHTEQSSASLPAMWSRAGRRSCRPRVTRHECRQNSQHLSGTSAAPTHVSRWPIFRARRRPSRTFVNIRARIIKAACDTVRAYLTEMGFDAADRRYRRRRARSRKAQYISPMSAGHCRNPDFLGLGIAKARLLNDFEAQALATRTFRAEGCPSPGHHAAIGEADATVG